MASRTTRRIVSSSAEFAGPAVIPFAYARTVPAPTNEPTLTDAWCCSIAPSHVANPWAPVNPRITRRCAVSAAMRSATSSTLSFTGTGVSPSPRIIVVTPCVIMLTMRLSPVSIWTYDCA